MTRQLSSSKLQLAELQQYENFFLVMATFVNENFYWVSPPSATYLRQWTWSALVQRWNIVNETHRNTLQWKSIQNSKLCIHENAFETIVCEMAAMLSRKGGGGKFYVNLDRKKMYWRLCK